MTFTNRLRGKICIHFVAFRKDLKITFESNSALAFFFRGLQSDKSFLVIIPTNIINFIKISLKKYLLNFYLLKLVLF